MRRQWNFECKTDGGKRERVMKLSLQKKTELRGAMKVCLRGEMEGRAMKFASRGKWRGGKKKGCHESSTEGEANGKFAWRQKLGVTMKVCLRRTQVSVIKHKP